MGYLCYDIVRILLDSLQMSHLCLSEVIFSQVLPLVDQFERRQRERELLLQLDMVGEYRRLSCMRHINMFVRESCGFISTNNSSLFCKLQQGRNKCVPGPLQSRVERG